MKQRIAFWTAGLMLCLTLLTTCLTCGMYARYTTAGTASDRARVAAFGQLTLELNKPDGQESILLMPRKTASTALDPRVSMTKSEVAVVVYVDVILPEESGWAFDQAHNRFTCGEILWTVAAGWTYLEANGKTYTFYHTLAPGEILEREPAVVDGIMTVPQTYDNYYDLSDSDAALDITFKVRAAQID